MIAYRSDYRMAPSALALAAICADYRRLEGAAQPAFEAVQRLLIDFGMFEAGLADALNGELEASCEETRTLRRASQALGRWFHAAYRNLDCGPARERFGGALAEVASLLLPAKLRLSTPEGYAHYGLYPEGYIESAEQYVAAREPQRAVVIGIRGIGSSLSAAVTGTLEHHGCRVRSYTVRPLGHPFDRQLRIADTLEREWHTLRGCDFVIVDEGPGISGSSLACVAAVLSGCGVPAEQISFFPSWDAQPDQLLNTAARQRWNAHRRYVPPARPAWLDGMRDLSAGQWRPLVYGGNELLYPAVQPQHEALKFLPEPGVLLKFAGLGACGEGKLEMARRLSAAGFSPGVLGFTKGFLACEFVPGRPLTAADVSPALLDRIAAYLAYRARSFPAARSVSFDSLLELIETNTREALGVALDTDALRRAESCLQDRPAVAVDGRMMPHEWIETSRGILKTDAVDHHADHFYPGAADIAWDVAAAGVELRLRPPQQQILLTRYAAHSGDRIPADALRFHRVAYLAFRTGYASLAADATQGSPDHGRFMALKTGYAALLQRDVLRGAHTRPLLVTA